MLTVEDGESSASIEGYSVDAIKYHQALLIEAGLLQGHVSKHLEDRTGVPSAVLIQKITWEGHEFLDAVRKEAVWETVKTEFKEAGLSTVVKVSKQLAEGWAQKKAEELLKG